MKKQKVLPAVSILVKQVGDLTREEYGQLRRICYRKDTGLLHDNLIYARTQAQPKSSVVMAKVKGGNQILSWAMIDRDRFDTDDRKLPEVCYWTQVRWRRLGLGRMVADAVRKLVGSTYDHYPEQNPGFFKAIKAEKVPRKKFIWEEGWSGDHPD